MALFYLLFLFLYRFSFFVALFTSFEIQRDGKITFAGDASEQVDIKKGSFQRML